ncbi:hypothetical protein H310_12137 [Aphanomyces invadans]|uniref:N-acetyltransferase domain-containing protein n=1 Tax=Aphanomyces invadans TaxID=157072 RepID=A0A024TL95_9STRA|nr:hypothetical protein H310_12137 [Aphanomyces invadans]ETV94132.1 hypothetical protein H310_12137 [Aphanomyces invadans]|eukprot:XP_008877335.1 hypothetical protein H310_12137 [Aphanomyces invadans]
MEGETRVRRATADERDVVEAFLRAAYVESGKSFPFVQHTKQDAWMFVAEDSHGDTVAATSAVWDPVMSTVTMEHVAVALHWRNQGVGSQLLAGVDAFVQVEIPTCKYLAFITDASPKMEAWARDRLFREVSGGFLPDATGRYVVYRCLMTADQKESHDIMGDFLAQVIDHDDMARSDSAQPNDLHQDEPSVLASLLTKVSLGKFQAIATSLDAEASASDAGLRVEWSELDGFVHETPFPCASPGDDNDPSLDSLVRLLMHQLKDPAQRRPLFDDPSIATTDSTTIAAARAIHQTAKPDETCLPLPPTHKETIHHRV